MTKDLATEIVKFIQADLESQWGELGRAFEDLDVEASHGITAGWLAGISEILEEDEKDQFVNRNPRQINI
jgi:hypothetical protein